jgi:hypothetical protein
MPPVSQVNSNTPQPGQPPAARNAPPVAAISNRKTMRSLNSTTTVCNALRQPPTLIAPPSSGWSNDSVTLVKDMFVSILSIRA